MDLKQIHHEDFKWHGPGKKSKLFILSPPVLLLFNFVRTQIHF